MFEHQKEIMSLLFDLSATQPRNNVAFHGGSEYAKVIFYELVKHKIKFDVLIYKNDIIDAKILNVCEIEGLNALYYDRIDDVLNILSEKKYDLFYSALAEYRFDFHFPEETKYIYTLHDTRYIDFCGDKYEVLFANSISQRIKAIIKYIFPSWIVNRKKKVFGKIFSSTNNRTIITVSRYSKYSLINYFPFLEYNEIKVLYSPEKKVIYEVNDEISESQLMNRLGIEKNKYFLQISGNRSEKNNYRALMALDTLFSENRKELIDYKSVLLGVPNPRVYYSKLKNKDKFVVLGYLDAIELEFMYKNAHLFIYPTLNEGFGYPPLEAMKYNTPVACSAVASITEICGDAVVYFNPYDIDEIRKRVLQSMDSEFLSFISNRMKIRCDFIKERQKRDLQLLVDMLLKESKLL